MRRKGGRCEVGKQHLERGRGCFRSKLCRHGARGALVHELCYGNTHLSPPALEPRYATFTGPSQIRALDARSSSSSGSLRPEAAAARSCMNLSTSSTLVGMGAWVVKASGIGNFGQALERHGSLSPAFKRRGLSPQAQRALPSGPRGSPPRPRGRPRRTGGPLEQWVAASSAASEGAF